MDKNNEIPFECFCFMPNCIYELRTMLVDELSVGLFFVSVLEVCINYNNLEETTLSIKS